MLDNDRVIKDIQFCISDVPGVCSFCSKHETEATSCREELLKESIELLEERQREIATLHSLLEEQRQQIEVLEHWKPEWIPTRVDMPKEGQIVLVVTPEYTDGEGNEYTEGVQCAYWLFQQDPTWFSSDGVTYGNGGRIVNPTHWIELPIPPKEGEQE